MKPLYLIIGLPGSGKNTQGILLAKELNLHHIDAGDSIKEYIDSLRNTDQEKADNLIKGYQAGPATPSDVFFLSIKKKLELFDDGKGVVLTQNALSVEEMEQELLFFENLNFDLKRVFCLDVTADVAIERAIKRLNNKFTEKEPNIESLKLRVEKYYSAFHSVRDFLKCKEILSEVDGSLLIDDVFQNILKAIKIAQ